MSIAGMCISDDRSIEHAYGAGDGDMGCSMGKTGSNGKDVIVQVHSKSKLVTCHELL